MKLMQNKNKTDCRLWSTSWRKTFWSLKKNKIMLLDSGQVKAGKCNSWKKLFHEVRFIQNLAWCSCSFTVEERKLQKTRQHLDNRLFPSRIRHWWTERYLEIREKKPGKSSLWSLTQVYWSVHFCPSSPLLLPTYFSLLYSNTQTSLFYVESVESLRQGKKRKKRYWLDILDQNAIIAKSI